jgi:hypothetical protein
MACETPQHDALLADLRAFTDARLERAGQLAAAPALWSSARLHAYLREAWEALDGLAREANARLQPRRPDVPLYPPDAMTRQCTFYMVRKILHEHARDHPLARHFWSHTREEADAPYRALSFYYNLSLFLPVPLHGDRLPAPDELPAHAHPLLKAQPVDGGPVHEKVRQVHEWLSDFVSVGRRLLERGATR